MPRTLTINMAQVTHTASTFNPATSTGVMTAWYLVGNLSTKTITAPDGTSMSVQQVMHYDGAGNAPSVQVQTTSTMTAPQIYAAVQQAIATEEGLTLTGTNPDTILLP